MQNLEYTDDRFGTIEFALEERYINDNLDRDAIWDEAGHNYLTQQHIYMDIAGELFGGHPDFDELVFETRDFGVRVLLLDTDEWFYLEAGASPAHVA